MATRASVQYFAVVLTSVFITINTFAADVNILNSTHQLAFLNSPPTLFLSPQGPYVVNENEEIQIQLIGSDPDSNEVLYYSANGLSGGAQLNMTTGLFKWKPQYNQAGTHKIIFFVSDRSGLSDTASAVITVNNVNRAPAFTTVFPPGMTYPYFPNREITYMFLFTASDPDGDPLVFSLETKIEGVSVTTTGVFMWTVKAAQAYQDYVVRVKVTDGEYFAETSAVVSVGGNIIVDTFTDVELSSDLPNEFQLYQNYPNPFNPETTIGYTLHVSGYTTLKIYDVLGREIATLVNEYQQAGKYSVRFNVAQISNLRNSISSGVYFYALRVGDSSSSDKPESSEFKKMVLLK